MSGYKKIVDTIPNFGRAEEYIAFSADFKRFLRNKFKVKEIKEIDHFEIVKKYNLKGIVFGNYVTQEERYFFLFKISKQLEALAKIKGSNNLGFGLLIIAFGVEGKARANAHFNPNKCLINLSRGRKMDYQEWFKGESSFVHEYGHFVDFCIGFSNKSFNRNFASEARGTANDSNINNIANATRLIQSDKDYMEGLGQFSNAVYLESDVEIWARLFEAAITHIVHKRYKDFERFFERRYTEKHYFPKDKIFKNKLDKSVITSLKNFTLKTENLLKETLF